MNKQNKPLPDDPFKDLLSGTRLKAGENLKYRIMQQVETEKALLPQKVKSNRPLVSSMFSTFGVMYLLIAMIGFGVYLTGGQSALESAAFFLPVILIASVCSFFWMISAYDDRRRSKQ